ncbi:PREDICTED: single-stranded DNA-binding protein 2-like [Leptosomus discolor]|uniref:single-stranded DNA-binding protein 2-like n=1 Tax=Leptosomus discolor TaxID=188344 RepID=UPI000522CF35|nr:PREDICTED: single-stranded DNA-binding protein 2-like [Leptosomus discolor]
MDALAAAIASDQAVPVKLNVWDCRRSKESYKTLELQIVLELILSQAEVTGQVQFNEGSVWLGSASDYLREDRHLERSTRFWEALLALSGASRTRSSSFLSHVKRSKSMVFDYQDDEFLIDRRLREQAEMSESSTCKAFDFYLRKTSATLSKSKSVITGFNSVPPFMSPRYPGGPRPPLRIPNQALGGVPGSQPLLPSGMDPTRQQGHPNMGGPMQRMTPPRGMVPLGPQNYGGAMRPPLNALGGPGMPGMNMGPGGGRPWPNPTNANSIPYSSASPGNYVGPPGGGGPPGTPIMPSPADSTNSGDNMYTLMNAVPPGPNRPNFPMGPGSDGPMSGLGGMDSHHMNGSLGSGDMDSISKNSPSNMSMSNQPGTPRDDGEMGGNFLNPFQSESYSPSMTMSV